MTRLFKIILIAVSGLILILLMLLRPTHSTQTAYDKLIELLDTLKFEQAEVEAVHVAWSKVNITPTLPVSMAGYGKREAHSVHDSLYIRFLIFETSATAERFILLTADLLIFPPALHDLLLEKLLKIGIRADHIYMTATHTHSSIGGWSPTLASGLYLGSYRAEFWETITEQIVEDIQTQKPAPAQIGYLELDGRRWVKNRVDHRKPIDARVRVVKLKRRDGKTACLTNFSAHATVVDAAVLSADYPGAVVEDLETDSAIDFAMFVAGAVGSHAVAHKALPDFELIETISQSISYEILKQFENIPLKPLNQIDARRFELPLPEPQLRINQKWTLAPSLFENILGKFKAHASFLKLNDLIFIGLPCDFSGEIAVRRKFYATSRAMNRQLIISSFNGSYIGYITPDAYYNTVEHPEVKEMNWFGAGGERYFSTLITDILAKQK